MEKHAFDSPARRRRVSLAVVALPVLFGAVLLFLVSRPGDGAVGWLLLIVLLACPLLHMFHHSGHGRNRAHSGPRPGQDAGVDGRGRPDEPDLTEENI